LGELGHHRRSRRPGAVATDVRARIPIDPRVRLCRAAPALPTAERERGVRVPRAGLPVLGRGARRLRLQPPFARTGMESRGYGPRRVPAAGPTVAGMAPHEPRLTSTSQASARKDPMTKTRWARRLAPLAVALTLSLHPAPARAQEPAPEGAPGESSSGR